MSDFETNQTKNKKLTIFHMGAWKQKEKEKRMGKATARVYWLEAQCPCLEVGKTPLVEERRGACW